MVGHSLQLLDLLPLPQHLVPQHLLVALEFLLGLRQLLHLLGKLRVSQTQAVDLLPQLLLHIDVVLSNLFELAVLLLELSLGLGGDLLLDPEHLFEDIDVLLKGASDLLVLLQFVREENFHVAQRLELGFVVFSDLLAGPLVAADQGVLDAGALLV